MLVDAGFESLWSVQAVGRGFMVSDPLIALAAVAAATERVELGTAVLQVPLYQPVDLAHRVLSLMQLCGDRLTLGVGAGSTRNDFDAFDRGFDARFATLTSHLEVLRTLFADGKSGGANLSPWAAVVGGPPVLFGSWGAGVERAATDFDGWIASAMHRSTDEIVAAHSRFRAAGGKRAMVSTIQLRPDVDVGELKDTLARFAEVGFDDAITLFFPGGPAPADVRDLLPS
jgi:alkanesulfonate monooxygenase SsuD/methylene tetrahydromethanopterin reductase-like flavin-dependent oxidoreductase (luciferase family)